MSQPWDSYQESDSIVLLSVPTSKGNSCRLESPAHPRIFLLTVIPSHPFLCAFLTVLQAILRISHFRENVGEEKGQLVDLLEMWGFGFQAMMCSSYFFCFSLASFGPLPFLIFQVVLCTLGKKCPK